MLEASCCEEVPAAPLVRRAGRLLGAVGLLDSFVLVVHFLLELEGEDPIGGSGRADSDRGGSSTKK